MTFVATTSHFPPPLNNLFVNVAGRGRVRSERYRIWRVAAGHDFRLAQMARSNPPPMQGPVACIIELVPPDNRKRDLDGMAKALIDQLPEHLVINDDNQIADLRLMWVKGPKPWAARVSVWPIEIGG